MQIREDDGELCIVNSEWNPCICTVNDPLCFALKQESVSICGTNNVAAADFADDPAI